MTPERTETIKARLEDGTIVQVQVGAIAAAVKRWLESPDHNRWLLVMDNADDLPTQHHPTAIQSSEIPVHPSRTLIRKVKI